MSGEREERERKTPGLLDGLMVTAVAGALYFAYLKSQEKSELAETLLEVNDRETVEHFKAEQKKLEAKGIEGAGRSAVPVDAKLRNIPKPLQRTAVKQMVAKLLSDPLWQYVLGEEVGAHLDWIVHSNMEALVKQDKKAEVASVAWKSEYQCLLTRRYRETQGMDTETPLDIVATFALLHGAGVDPIYTRRESVTGLSAEQNNRLEAVGKFLNDTKLKHFFRKKQAVVEITRLVVNPYFEEKGIESLCVGEIIDKTKMPVLVVTQLKAEKDHLIQQLGFEVVEDAEFSDGSNTFMSYFLVKH